MKLTRLGDVQIGALQIYIFDPVHAEMGDVFPGRLEGRTLHVDDPEEAWRLLTEAANSADCLTGDPECDRLDRAARDALTGLAGRVLKIDRAEKEKR